MSYKRDKELSRSLKLCYLSPEEKKDCPVPQICPSGQHQTLLPASELVPDLQSWSFNRIFPISSIMLPTLPHPHSISPQKNQVEQSAKPLFPLHLSPSNLQILIFFHTLVQAASDDDLNAKHQRCYCAAGAGQGKRQQEQGNWGPGILSPAAPQGRLHAQKVQRILPAHPRVKSH